VRREEARMRHGAAGMGRSCGQARVSAAMVACELGSAPATVGRADVA
jgi:hypothetical protein